MRSLLAALTLFVLAGCSSYAGPAVEDVESARSRWMVEAMQNYRFDFERLCFCVPEAREPVTVEVRNGGVVGVTSKNTGASMLPSAILTWPTIDEIFEMIEEAEQSGEHVLVEFDSRGHPTMIEIGSLAADAGSRYLISNLTPLE